MSSTWRRDARVNKRVTCWLEENGGHHLIRRPEHDGRYLTALTRECDAILTAMLEADPILGVSALMSAYGIVRLQFDRRVTSESLRKLASCLKAVKNADAIQKAARHGSL